MHRALGVFSLSVRHGVIAAKVMEAWSSTVLMGLSGQFLMANNPPAALVARAHEDGDTCQRRASGIVDPSISASQRSPPRRLKYTCTFRRTSRNAVPIQE